jgi:TonB family protein
MKFFHAFAACVVVGFWGVLSASAEFVRPEAVISPQPRLSDELINKPCSAYAQLQVNEFGFVTDATIVQSSDSRLNEPVLAALRRWKFKPATDNGTAVPCFVVQPIRVGGGIIVTQPEVREDRDPSVRTSVKPELPRELRTIDGYVTARAEVDAQGAVVAAEISDSTHAELDPFVLAAVKQWRFTPAVRDGHNAPSHVAIPFRFVPDPKLLPREVKKMEETPTDSAPVALRRVPPSVPESVMGGDVSADIEFVVDAFGNVVSPTIIASTDDVFGASALEAITRWRFKPAMQGGQPVATKVRQQFAMHKQVLTAASDRTPPDSQPKLKKSVTPDVPAGLQGVKGVVEVQISIDEQGDVTEAQIRNASYAEFGAPATQAALQWKFSPAIRDGKPVASTAVVPFVFGH